MTQSTVPETAWTPTWSLGDRLRRIRRDLRLSQEQMAERLGEKKGTYGAWETDRNRPDDLVAVAKRLQLMCRVPASWVLGLDDSPFPDSPDGAALPSRLGESNSRPSHYKGLTNLAQTAARTIHPIERKHAA